jgi:hypothetical protein
MSAYVRGAVQFPVPAVGNGGTEETKAVALFYLVYLSHF